MTSPKWRLGGPNRFARLVAEDLENGKSTTIILPRRGAPDGLQAQVRQELPQLSAHRFGLGELADGRERVVDRLHTLLDLEPPPGGEPADEASFAAHPLLGRRLIWVDQRNQEIEQAERWGRFLLRYAAAARAVPPDRQTVFATLCDGAGAAVMPKDDHLLAMRWWWGVVEPLDTAVFVSERLRGERPLPAFPQTVAEVAAFDLDTATELADHWDGRVGSLRDALGVHEGAAGQAPLSWSPARTSRPQPPPESVAAWSSGMVNAWGEQNPRVHAAYLCRSEGDRILRELVWRAQIGQLMPRIEIERQALAKWVEQRRDHVPKGLQVEDFAEVELNALAKLFRDAPKLSNDKRRAELAQWLLRARNRLAHTQVLELSQLKAGRRLFRT